MQVQTCGRDQIVDVRLDKYLPVRSVAKHGRPTLYKRLLELSNATKAEAGLSQEEALQEALKHVGDFDREEPDENNPPDVPGHVRRGPRPPDRVRLLYCLRKRCPPYLFQTITGGGERGKDCLLYTSPSPRDS